MKVLAVIQARMGSTRLPGKVLMDVAGQPMLRRVLERVRRARSVEGVVVATSDREADDAISGACSDWGIECQRGSADDVLDRFARVVRMIGPEVVVRVTADCPLIDPDVIDRVVSTLLCSGADYVGNVVPPRTFPRGLDVEALRAHVLLAEAEENRDPRAREHVTWGILSAPGRWRVNGVWSESDLSVHRWTVDVAEDLELVRSIHGRLGEAFGWRDALALIEREPELRRLNAHVEQRPV